MNTEPVYGGVIDSEDTSIPQQAYPSTAPLGSEVYGTSVGVGMAYPPQNANPNMMGDTSMQRTHSQSQSRPQPHQHQPDQGQGQGLNWQAGLGGIGMALPGGEAGEALGKLGMEYGQKMVQAGTDQINKYLGVEGIKRYFNVSNSYVVSKLKIILAPFLHKSWKRRALGRGEQVVPMPPRDDDNSPDLYIPIMSFITYLLLVALVTASHSVNGVFDPSLLGKLTSTGLAVVLSEIVFVRGGLFFVDVVSVSIWDILAFTGYKFVGLSLSIAIGLMFGSTLYYISLIYCSLAMAMFMIRTLRLIVLPDVSVSGGHHRLASRRNYFLVIVGLVQIPIYLFAGPGNLLNQPEAPQEQTYNYAPYQ